MKNLTIFFLLLISLPLAAQQRETVTVPAFTKIGFGVPGKAYVRQGNTQKVELEGTRDAIDKVEVRVEGNKLVIRSKEKWFNWNWTDTDRINAYITVKDIEGLSVSGSGDMIVENRIRCNALKLSVSGSGSLKVETDAGDTEVNVSGSGDMIVRGSLASFTGDISGSGKIEMNAAVSGNAAFEISGSGKAVASGKSSGVDVDISGSGKVLAADLETSKCRVRISGSGSVEINVKDELDAKISGSGDVRYRGNPAHVNAHSSGSGSVKKLTM
ncbi:MAG: DUF2807 domain-containing protein [Flammeovirgaceae bacterium]|nr:MAG: DUF2807 domain-containing protein [Flammeovirgaceae bacterium]